VFLPSTIGDASQRRVFLEKVAQNAIHIVDLLLYLVSPKQSAGAEVLVTLCMSEDILKGLQEGVAYFCLLLGTRTRKSMR
jgi:hypothetical protein